MKKPNKFTITKFERIIELLLAGETCRSIAEKLGDICKSTIHGWIYKYTPIYYPMFKKVIFGKLEYNKQARAMRGGMANKAKWDELKREYNL